MKKVSVILNFVFAFVLSFSLYQYNEQVELNNTYVQKINQLEVEIASLSNGQEENLSQLENMNDGSMEKMTVRFPVFIGTDPVDDNGYIYLEKEISKNSSVLTATYNTLFNEPATIDLGNGNTAQNVVPNSGLSFESVSIQDGKAKVILSGTYLAMHMGDPVFRKQINKTAFQYPTVDMIEVLLNGQTFDWCIVDMSDGEGGCPEEPKLWIDEK